MNYFDQTTLKSTSQKLFNSKINEWISYLPDGFKCIGSILMLPDFAVKHLNTHIKTNTNSNKHIYYMSILSIFRHRNDLLTDFPSDTIKQLQKQWSDIFYQNEQPIIQRRLENRPTDNQLKKGGVNLDFNHIVSVRNDLPEGSIERLLICMYTMIPPVRADYFATQIVYGEDVPTEKNYIRFLSDFDAQCILTDFKTAKSYNQITNDLPPQLIYEIQASLEKQPRNYLFLNANGVPHTRNSFVLWSRRALTRIFSVDFTLVFFRHAFITNFISTNDMAQITDGELKEISDKMGHSSEMFRAYKWVKNGRQGNLVIDTEDGDEKNDD